MRKTALHYHEGEEGGREGDDDDAGNESLLSRETHRSGECTALVEGENVSVC